MGDYMKIGKPPTQIQFRQGPELDSILPSFFHIVDLMCYSAEPNSCALTRAIFFVSCLFCRFLAGRHALALKLLCTVLEHPNSNAVQKQ